MKETFKYIGLVIVLFVFGFFMSRYFIELSVFQINNNNIELVHTKMAGQFNRRLLFGLSIGLIPILFFFVNKLIKLRSFKQKLTAYLIIIVTGIIFWQYRILDLTNIIDQFPNFGIKTSVDIDNLKLEIFFLTGLITGAILSVVIFRIIKSNNEEK